MKKYEELLAKANAHYATLKAKSQGVDLSYTAPEALPKIQSDQVKAILMALSEQLEKEGI